MSLRFIVMVLVLMITAAMADGNRAIAQQANKNQQQLLTAMTGTNGNTIIKMDPRAPMVDRLHFRSFEAAAGDLSSCADDAQCIKDANAIKSWGCASDVCDGKVTGHGPISCFNGLFDHYSVSDKLQIDSSICPAIKSPSPQTRRALINNTPGATEVDLVESIAYVLALRGSASSCEAYIKNYVGAYGPQWTYDWYRDLSGCRILAHERTRDQEEKDYFTWFGVAQGLGSCTGIINGEMRAACSTPGAASPLAVYGQ